MVPSVRRCAASVRTAPAGAERHEAHRSGLRKTVVCRRARSGARRTIRFAQCLVGGKAGAAGVLDRWNRQHAGRGAMGIRLEGSGMATRVEVLGSNHVHDPGHDPGLDLDLDPHRDPDRDLDRGRPIQGGVCPTIFGRGDRRRRRRARSAAGGGHRRGWNSTLGAFGVCQHLSVRRTGGVPGDPYRHPDGERGGPRRD